MPLTQQTQTTSESFGILTVLKLNVTLPDYDTRFSLLLPFPSQSYQGNGEHHEGETEEKPTSINFNIKTKDKTKEHHI